MFSLSRRSAGPRPARPRQVQQPFIDLYAQSSFFPCPTFLGELATQRVKYCASRGVCSLGLRPRSGKEAEEERRARHEEFLQQTHSLDWSPSNGAWILRPQDAEELAWAVKKLGGRYALRDWLMVRFSCFHGVRFCERLKWTHIDLDKGILYRPLLTAPLLYPPKTSQAARKHLRRTGEPIVEVGGELFARNRHHHPQPLSEEELQALRQLRENNPQAKHVFVKRGLFRRAKPVSKWNFWAVVSRAWYALGFDSRIGHLYPHLISRQRHILLAAYFLPEEARPRSTEEVIQESVSRYERSTDLGNKAVFLREDDR